jgi:LacI family transcriptional regulator
MRRVTIDDVAREAGVSRQTVSRAINHKRDISVETRERVLAVVQRLGFRPNRVAQSMITQRTYTIGMEVIDITNPVFAEMVRGAQDTAAAYGYNILLTNSNDDSDIAIHSLSTLVTHGIDGLIAMFPNVADDEILAFADHYHPIVLINRVVAPHPHLTMLSVDIYRGATLAMEHLLQRGHTAIGMIANRHHPHAKNRRLTAYQDSLQRYGFPTPPQWVQMAVPTLQGGYAATRELLQTDPTLTAIFAYNDLMAVGAIRACRDMGYSVPKEIAIMGFDDIPIAELVHPALSTIRYDKYGLGQQAILHILHHLNHPNETLPIADLAIELVERESTQTTVKTC